MKVKGAFKYIFFCFLFFCSGLVKAQIPLDAPVVPIPLHVTATDSAEILKAKYDSLVAHMGRLYLKETPVEKQAVQKPDAVKTISTDTASKPITAQLIEKTAATGSVEGDPITIHTEPVTTQTIPSPPPSITPAVVPASIETNNPIVSVPAPASGQMPPINTQFNPLAQDTPRIRLPKDSIKGDTMLLDEIGTEEQLVDTNAVENQSDISDGDDADEEGDAEGEFDNIFTGYADVSYWDMLRDPNFKFDEAMIPANTHYPYDW
ncbi:MAG: hypothetical protein V4658_12100, partial [Bacteroidota bacterium]